MEGMSTATRRTSQTNTNTFRNESKGSIELENADPYQLGRQYFYGIKGKQNLTLACHYYLIAAAQGDKRAAAPLRIIGETYCTDEFIGHHNANAFTCTIRAAELGDIKAIYNLKTMYLKNILIADEKRQLKSFLEDSYRSGDIHGTYCSGLILEGNKGDERIKLAASKGLTAANRYLGNQYESQCRNLWGTAEDFNNAIHYYEKAKTRPEIVKKLAKMYRDGWGLFWGVAPNGEKAIECYKFLAENWKEYAPKAYDEIAQIYWRGNGGVAINEQLVQFYIAKSKEASEGLKGEQYIEMRELG